MSYPEKWLHATIEKAAECRAYPSYVPRTAEVPFVYFSRTGTEREHDMEGNPGVPVATFDVSVFADTYLRTKEIADRIRRGVDNFSGEAAGVTITQTRISDERDGEPVFFTGEDVPIYTVELTLDIRFREVV
jgi:hypothetical protein